MADLHGHHSNPQSVHPPNPTTTGLMMVSSSSFRSASTKDKMPVNVGAIRLCLLPDLCPEKLIKQTNGCSAILKNQSTDGSSIDEQHSSSRVDRYDSSESSSDSGVASMTCSDASPWSSSSDITEPLSPSSPGSSQPSPLSQTQTEGSGAPERAVDVALLPSPTSALLLPEVCPAPCSARRRRHSESTAGESAPDEVDGKRARRPSGNDKDKEPRASCLANWPSNTKWLTYMWKSNGGPDKDVLELPGRNAPSSAQSVQHKRQSWPLNNNNRLQHQQPLAQLKITEFFSSQVKHHWSYSKASAGLKELRERLSDEPAESSVPSAARDDIVVKPSGIIQDATRIPASPLNDTLNDKSTPSAPQQIRFPALHQGNKAEAAATAASPEVAQCLWHGCTATLSPGQSLLEHIQSAHVATQASTPHTVTPSSSTSSSSSASSPVPESPAADSTSEQYSCQWEGCKVQGKKSSSRTWLERHVLLHVGNKPFRCIVDSCEQRFSSQAALERHVNAHFNQESGHQGPGGSHGVKRESASAKVARRHAKKLKNRLCITKSARLCDYFDAGIMERLRHQLVTSQVRQNELGLSRFDRTLTVHSQIIARRTDDCGNSKVLVRWTPADVLPDQWVMEDQVVSSKRVPLHNTSAAAQTKLDQQMGCPVVRVKQRRK